MEEHKPRPGEEWGGHKPSEFLPNKKHIDFQPTIDPTYKQMFDSLGRKHYEKPGSQQHKWKPSVQQVNFAEIHEVKKPSKKSMVPNILTEAKNRAERIHLVQAPSGTYEDDEVGKKTFVYHNRKSMNEFLTTDLMGRK